MKIGFFRKRAAQILLALLFAIVLLQRGTAAAAQPEEETLTVEYVNPIYQDVYESSTALWSRETENSVQPAALSEEEVYSETEAIAYMRQQMSLRNSVFSFYVVLEQEVTNEKVYQLTDSAMGYTDSSASYEADAILGDFMKWSCSICPSGQNIYLFQYQMSYFTTPQQEQELRSAVSQKTAELCGGVASEYEKIKRIYEYICTTVVYDYNNLEDDTYTLKYSAYAAMMDRTAVCQGYATLFYRMCTEAGLSARLITGTTCGGGGHAWNIVRLSGLYYNMDTTWDAAEKTPLYLYFLKSNADFSDHIRSEEYETDEFCAAYPMAAASYKSSEETTDPPEETQQEETRPEETQSEETEPSEEESKLNGLAYRDGVWYYYRDGEIDRSYTGLTRYYGTWYYVKNGVLDWDYTGLTQYYGTWYYVEKGVLNWNAVTLVYYNGTWYYVQNGSVNWDYTGLAKYNGGWYYVQNGSVNWKYTGLTQYYGTWYYVQNGFLNWNYTSLAYYNGSWYYVEKGVLNWNYTGLAKYNGGWYYVQKGTVNWNYTGLTQYYGTWYYVQKGFLKWGYNGLVYHNGGWYYLENSMINWNYSGAVLYYGTLYYVDHGFLDWTYCGTAEYEGKTYQVVNGVLY